MQEIAHINVCVCDCVRATMHVLSLMCIDVYSKIVELRFIPSDQNFEKNTSLYVIYSVIEVGGIIFFFVMLALNCWKI